MQTKSELEELRARIRRLRRRAMKRWRRRDRSDDIDIELCDEAWDLAARLNAALWLLDKPGATEGIADADEE
jgi:hypothetical protein